MKIVYFIYLQTCEQCLLKESHVFMCADMLSNFGPMYSMLNNPSQWSEPWPKVQIIPQTTEICHSISYSSDNEICFRKVTDFSQTTKTCHCKLFFRQLKSWHTHYSSDNRNLLQYKLFLRQQRFVIFTLILWQLNFVMYKFVLRQMKLCNVTLFLKLKSVA